MPNNKVASKRRKSSLLDEVMVDAKLVKAIAVQNATAALKEAFTPKLQRMISAKLAEEDESSLEGEDELPVDGGEGAGEDFGAEGGEEDFGGEEGGEEELPTEEPVAEGDDEFSLDAIAGEDGGEEELPTEEPVAEGDDELQAGDEFGGEDEEDDLDLETIIRELEADSLGGEEEQLPTEEPTEEVPVEENADTSGIGTGDNKQPSSAASDDSTQDPGKNKLFETDEEAESEEDLTIEEIIKALREEEDPEVEQLPDGGSEETIQELTSQLQEAYKVINFLRGQLSELNNLNAKLLYTGKLFKKFDLNESQKVKVVEAFDRANTIRDIKLVFTTLAEALNTAKSYSKKSTLKEAANRNSSRVQRTTKPSREILSEGDVMAKRFQELAFKNLKKR